MSFREIIVIIFLVLIPMTLSLCVWRGVYLLVQALRKRIHFIVRSSQMHKKNTKENVTVDSLAKVEVWIDE